MALHRVLDIIAIFDFMYDALCLPNSYINFYTLTDYALTD